MKRSDSSKAVYPARSFVLEILVCSVCRKPLRFEADMTSTIEPAVDEPIMCPYDPHDAGSRVTTGFGAVPR